MSAAPDPVVRTGCGAVRGRLEAGLAAFRGIPYAAAPVGPHRLAAPQPVPAWDGERPAVAFGPPPPQSAGLGGSAGTTGEEWLSLNVWTPSPDPAAGLPVLVWVPGGGYVVGDAGLPEYDGGVLARAGMVVVTLSYRLGVEGFALLAGAPANRGLLDQVAALHWVRENVAGFGGDPSRVTVAGQSAGGGSVAALLAMPSARGLFARAAALSVPGTFFSSALARDVAAACAAELGVAPTAEGFASVEPDVLPLAGDAVAADVDRWRGRWGPVALRPIPFAPVVDGEVLPTTPWRALADGAARDLPLLVGHTRDEHRLFSLLDGVLGRVTAEEADAALRVLAPAPDGPAGYRAAFPGASDEELYELVHGDWLFRMPSLHLAEAQVAGGGRVHLCELTWPAPGLGGVLGACHGLDLPLVLGTLDRGQPAALLGDPVPPEAVALSERLRSAWAAFVAGDDPGWPAHDPEGRATLLLDVDDRVAVYPEDASRRLWAHHTFDPLPLLAP